MKARWAIGILAVLVIAMGTVALMAAQLPDVYTVTRERMIQATPTVVYQWVGDLRRWEDWSPWKQHDATIVNEYFGSTTGVGAVQKWTSKNSGAGQITLTTVEPERLVEFDLLFIDWNAKSHGALHMEPTAQGTKVIWTLSGAQGFMQKIFSVIFRMDKAMADDFDLGLQLLAEKAEQQ